MNCPFVNFSFSPVPHRSLARTENFRKMLSRTKNNTRAQRRNPSRSRLVLEEKWKSTFLSEPTRAGVLVGAEGIFAFINPWSSVDDVKKGLLEFHTGEAFTPKSLFNIHTHRWRKSGHFHISILSIPFSIVIARACSVVGRRASPNPSRNILVIIENYFSTLVPPSRPSYIKNSLSQSVVLGKTKEFRVREGVKYEHKYF